MRTLSAKNVLSQVTADYIFVLDTVGLGCYAPLDTKQLLCLPLGETYVNILDARFDTVVLTSDGTIGRCRRGFINRS